jgi:hypothetical protein
MAKDRRGELLRSTTLNGIDFVEIANQAQTALRVHFLNQTVVKGTVSKAEITGGQTIPEVLVRPIKDADWSVDADGNPLLTLRVDAPGDFSTYTLTLTSAKLDSYFARAKFSFKALCESPLDCKPAAQASARPAGELPPIDYLAKDALSFRKALSDFSALRYPEWRERSEADFGMMALEALSSLADDLSYTQDRVAAEATLDTATQRRSLVRHARLVDYEPWPAVAARTLLQFHMTGPGPILPGLLVSAASPDGAPVFFETGTGMADQASYQADPLWNSLTPYYFDDSQRYLKAGATEMWVEGHDKKFFAGQLLLLETAGETEADPPVRQIVRLTDPPSEEDVDEVFSPATDVTCILWRAEDALLADRDLTKTGVKGNLVPATQGRRYVESFAIETPPASAPSLPQAVYRLGPNSTDVYRYTLGQAPLAWLAQGDSSTSPRPEIELTEQCPSGLARTWKWFRRLLDAGEFDRGFTMDPVRFSRTAANSDGSTMLGYDGDEGDTLRFGDGVFGDIPEAGALFQVTYRMGGGRIGNVAPDSVWRIEGTAAADRVANPFAAQGGADAQTDLSVRRLAPQAFRSQQYRAVRREDYQDAAQKLSWVQRAGTTFRWTGSWLTVFTTPDPKGTGELSTGQRIELIDLLNRYRLAGYESYVPSPRYAALDLKITVVASSQAFRGDVSAAVLEALSSRRLTDGSTGFFHYDRFTFGTPLERSALEAAIQETVGVEGVSTIEYRRRGYTASYVEMPETVEVGMDEIILVENNPSRPECGSLKVTVEGGK